ncbi:ABC transporter ATP-binding protein [Glaciihabitans tibetensis]|uniref:ABC transporter ATP-binding protein n=1 Tax=Glaciihabitans tibetensis TaxID=1266600 RepID=UPI000D082594
MSAVGSHAIEVRSLQKSFGTHPALRDLNLSVEVGEVHGFLGPNGAGKSTTIRILLGLIHADSGSARVLARDPWAQAVDAHRRLAYVPGDVSLWPTLTGGEVIDLLTRMRGGADPALRTRLLDDFELDPRKKCRAYSRGNRQKVALVAALARPSELYIFDEPTAGLDPVMESVFRAHVERVRAEGSTVLLSSHILSEVEKTCDRVTIIRAGVTVETGSLAEMRHLTRTTFTVVGGVTVHDVAALPGVHNAVAEGNGVQFDVDTEHLTALLARLAERPVLGLTVAPPSLEALFLRHYSGAEAER